MNAPSVGTLQLGRPSGPPQPNDTGEGGGSDWVLLTTAANQVIALLIEGRLGEDGISCLLDGFNPSPGAWLKPFGDPLAPVKVYVHRHDLGSASLLLHEVGHAAPDSSDSGPRSVKTLWWATIVVVAALTMLLVADMMGAFQGATLRYLR
ncbi:MAG: hypothetical protein ACR2FO_05225 [Actinomycetota bacterium]